MLYPIFTRVSCVPVNLTCFLSVRADLLIHYGNSCLSRVSESASQAIPVLWVYGKAELDVADCVNKLTERIISNTQPEELTNLNLVLMYALDCLHLRGIAPPHHYKHHYDRNACACLYYHLKLVSLLCFFGQN